MANHSRDSIERARRVLGDLADTLGCSIDVFFQAAQHDDVAMTEELLTLWFSIEDARARNRILDCARAVQAEAAARERA